MNRLLSLFLILTLAWLDANAQKVEFFEGSWEDALAEAARTERPILFDAYTDWCYWCKVQDRETFADPKIAGYINEHFVPVKFDMEKGEGVALAMKFRVTGFPTTLFFNTDGQLTSKRVGYIEDKSEYMQVLREAESAESGRIFGFDSDEIDVAFPDFYKKAFTGYTDKKEFPEKEEVAAWLEQQEDLLAEVPWSVIFRFPLDDHFNQFFLDHYRRYEVLYGEAETEQKLMRIAYDLAGRSAEAGQEDLLEDAVKIVQKHMPEDIENNELDLRIYAYEKAENWPMYTDMLGLFIDRNGFDNVDPINSMSWKLYEDCDDRKQLLRATAWMKSVVEQAPEYMYLDTYAALLYKTGDLEKAEAWAQAAIEAGQKNEDDVSATEELLEEIRGAQ